MDTVFEALGKVKARGNRMQVSGLGVFDTRIQAACPARNPRTREIIQLSEGLAPGI